MTDSILDKIAQRSTPFYLYDMAVLRNTLDALNAAAAVCPKFRVHYAVKACYAAPVLAAIRDAGLGIDAVSGGEIRLAVDAGFDPSTILFAGVGKTDDEIDTALDAGIGCFNVESLPELDVIAERAAAKGVVANVALRINPDIDAHTHHCITTGLAENKFGINGAHLDEAVDRVLALPSVRLHGLHFHIGSQITVTEPFALLSRRINDTLQHLQQRGIRISAVDVGGGLAIDYDDPTALPAFKPYFDTFAAHLDTSLVDTVHFELGRAVVGQCGTLISRVVYVKEGDTRTFAIIDAGMSELIRPALYGARHPISNLSGDQRGDAAQTVDIVGPVCESSDVFGADYSISAPQRGDIIAIGSAGAYGEVMSSHYNCRSLQPPMYI